MDVKIILTVAIASTLVACATPQQRTADVSWDDLSTGEKQVTRVNQEARRRGIDVIWVNPPTQHYQDRKHREQRRETLTGND